MRCVGPGVSRKRFLVLACVLTALVVGPLGGLRTSSAQELAAEASSPRALLDRYCVTCHNGRLKTAGLELDSIDVNAVAETAPVWEKVVAKLRAGAMPPAGRPRPDDVARRDFVHSLETRLDRAAAEHPDPGRTSVLHRLNRTEYQNAIRDLLALEVDASALLPADDAAYGFDNIADLLSVSPTLLDRYLSAATKISRLAVGASSRTALSTYEFSKFLLQEERMSEDLPFGSRGGVAIRHYFPADGEYTIRIRFQGQANPPIPLEVRVDGERVAALMTSGKSGIEAPRDAGALDARFVAQAGSRVVGLALLKPLLAPEGRFPQYYPWGNSSVFFTTTGGKRYVSVSSVDITGPFNPTGPGDTPGRDRIFVCRPENVEGEGPCATEILATLARPAYRRPVTSEDVEVLMGFYEAARRDGGGFEVGIQAAVERLLVDPEFLFRVELDPEGVGPGVAYRVSDLELASRLSFFLWSSGPDDELLRLAEQGRLSDPAVFETQARRMLADERAAALIESFGTQWLFLRNVQIAAPDLYEFPEWDDNLRAALTQETELFLAHQLREDRSVTELLTADYTFLNERLARHYGVPNVYGSHFRRVTLPDDRRAGLLGHASILTVTSFPNRTSPVVRGKWLLENILGAPPPPPPANVPELEENEPGAAPRSIKERLEQHRRSPVCASCHATMDPLGFALEQYDAIGRWRDTEDGQPVDSTGALPDGTAIEGPAGLRELLMRRQGEFVKTVTEKLLTYALGRGLEHYDMPAVRQIIREAASTDHRWSSIILGITRSVPFQMRRTAS